MSKDYLEANTKYIQRVFGDPVNKSKDNPRHFESETVWLRKLFQASGTSVKGYINNLFTSLYKKELQGRSFFGENLN